MLVWHFWIILSVITTKFQKSLGENLSLLIKERQLSSKKKRRTVCIKKRESLPCLTVSIFITSGAKPIFRLVFPLWWSQWKWHLSSSLGHGGLRCWFLFNAFGILWGVCVNFPVHLSRRVWLVGDSWIYMHISTFGTISYWRFIQHKHYLKLCYSFCVAVCWVVRRQTGAVAPYCRHSKV